MKMLLFSHSSQILFTPQFKIYKCGNCMFVLMMLISAKHLLLCLVMNPTALSCYCFWFYNWCVLCSVSCWCEIAAIRLWRIWTDWAILYISLPQSLSFSLSRQNDRPRVFHSIPCALSLPPRSTTGSRSISKQVRETSRSRMLLNCWRMPVFAK